MWGHARTAQGKGTRREEEGCRYGIYYISVEIDSKWNVSIFLKKKLGCKQSENCDLNSNVFVLIRWSTCTQYDVARLSGHIQPGFCVNFQGHLIHVCRSWPVPIPYPPIHDKVRWATHMRLAYARCSALDLTIATHGRAKCSECRSCST